MYQPCVLVPIVGRFHLLSVPPTFCPMEGTHFLEKNQKSLMDDTNTENKNPWKNLWMSPIVRVCELNH